MDPDHFACLAGLGGLFATSRLWWTCRHVPFLEKDGIRLDSWEMDAKTSPQACGFLETGEVNNMKHVDGL